MQLKFPIITAEISIYNNLIIKQMRCGLTLEKKRWIWICMEQHSRQIVAFYVGSRDTSDAQSLWDRIPEVCKIQGKFYTDNWAPYKQVIPINQHVANLKKCKTNQIESLIALQDKGVPD